jgi:hypothetical protein
VLSIYVVFQMAGRQRRGKNECVPPPPPPPPTLQELMAQQNEILRQLAHRQPPPQHYGGGDHQRHPAAATYQEFLSTQPPLFTRAEDPLDADVWLRVVESKFPLLHGACSEVTKVQFATQQLRGPARTWWDHYLAMQPADHEVEWREFKAAFRGHHIPAGIIDRKLNEFLALTQGNRTVLQYAQAFNDLCQYAGYHADTDEKKRDRFRRGLSTKLRDRLNTVRANSYNELVNMAISQEDCITARQAEKKRKTPVAGPSAQPQRFRIVSDTQNRGPQQQQGRWVIRPQQQQQAPNRTQFPAQRNNQQQQQYRQANDNRCFTCGNTEHYVKNCPRNQQRQGQNVNQNQGKRQKVQVRQGKLNFTTMADIPEGAPVMTGIFTVLNCPAIILFDSGASHSFISAKFSAKCQLPFHHTHGGITISTPGGRIATNQISKNVPIKFGSLIIKTNLLILGLDSVDIILGTDWLTKHQAVIDIAARAIEVHSPTCGETTLFLPDQGCTRSCAFVMIESPVEKIPVVCGYPDVFPNELPGMPPDRDIEFAIELQPGTAPISKRPYRMPPAELAELKKQLQELLDKGLVLHHGDVQHYL